MTEVHILLATHNGAAFLQEQLQSYLDQDHPDWSLWVSDDASTDATRTVLAAFQRANPTRNITVFDGPDRGMFANFMHLLRHPLVPRGYVALSDQDDVWLPHRLSKAVQILKAHQGNAFYCSARILADERLKPLGPSEPKPFPTPSFQNALVQNLAPGNTMMLNPQAMDLLRADPMPPSNLPYHDWWIYLRLMAANADMVCDPQPSLLYRQHDNNFLGHRKTRRLQRMQALLDGTYGSWVKAYAAALLSIPPDDGSVAHRKDAEILLNHPARLSALRQSRAHRHDRAGRYILPMLAMLHRI